MDKWKTVNDYRILAESGIVDPIMCPACSSTDMATILGKDDEPEFWCLNCQSHTRPGLRVFDDMQRIINDVSDAT